MTPVAQIFERVCTCRNSDSESHGALEVPLLSCLQTSSAQVVEEQRSVTLRSQFPFPVVALGPSTYNVFIDELLDVVEVAFLGHCVVVIAVWQLLPDACLRFAKLE